MNVAAALRVVTIVALAAACDDSGTTQGADTADGADADAEPGDGSLDGEVTAGSCETLARPALDSLRLTRDGTRLRDALGRQVLLRGVNAGGSSKMPPFFPFPFAESGRPEQAGAPPFAQAAATYLDRVVAWGMNALRLPFTWEALEPTEGTYDTVWLDRYAQLVELAEARELRVVVDFHQDVYARTFCGDGFPLWTLEDPDAPIPEISECGDWFFGYFTKPEVAAAYDRFWAGEDGIREAFEAMWRKMAGRLWSERDAVVGFEVMNEPGWGSAEMNAWSAAVLTPFYTDMAVVIGEAAPGALVFFDATGQDGAAQETGLNRPSGDDLVFAPHYYDPDTILLGRWNGKADVTEAIGTWRSYGDAWDVPVLVGEFGIAADASGAADYVRRCFDGLDAHLLHGTLWEYSTTVADWNEEGMSLCDPGGAERATADEVVRAYPAAVAGTLSRFTFDRAARTAVVEYQATAGGVTEIAAPARLYPDGVEAEWLAGEGCVVYDAAGEVLLVRPTAAGRVELSLQPGR